MEILASHWHCVVPLAMAAAAFFFLGGKKSGE
jgi:hypothetical protein